ncbi:DUF2461 domain-containing protein [Apibacter sp. HY039]|uniref:DUF2461 domain-containing protein n=1 Tax=Apibacter sp. HY039 TaxID=2501476 RepID=UPI000FEB9464|nr:DUF2461 domain-containing protein [Apibacter sp. HY039]
MLHKKTLKFLKSLKKNNNREWFSENKDWYETSRLDFENLVKDLQIGLSELDITIKYLNPKKCIFRIYRDIRFSPDKTPYKNYMSAVFSEIKNSGYYLHIEPGKSFLTCGHYMLPPEQIKKIRKGIYDDFESFREIVENKNFIKEFGGLTKDETILKRVPNGFDKEHPSSEYLKFKNFYVTKSITDQQVLDTHFVTLAVSVYTNMQPFNDYINNLILD